MSREDRNEMPLVMLSTVEFKDGGLVLSLTDSERTEVSFRLHPMAAAILALTLQPALRTALDAEKAAHPEKFDEQGRPRVPDTPEGL